MQKRVSLVRFAWMIAALSPMAWAAWAQTPQAQPQVPAREGNIWGGVAHQPTAGGVQAEERAAGIAPPPQEQKVLNQDVDQLYRQLMKEQSPGTQSPKQQ